MATTTRDSGAPASDWWRFTDDTPDAPASGMFQAFGAERIGRLYVPLMSEQGMLSWTSPSLQGSPAASHHEYLSLPLTAEDLPHSLVHRGFWLVEADREPWSLSCLSPDGLVERAADRAADSLIDAGPGWFSLTRHDRSQRFRVRADLWCPADVPGRVEAMRVTVTNTGSGALTFDVYAAMPLFARSADNVRDHRHVTALLHRIHKLPHGVNVCPTMSFDERGHPVNTVRYMALAIGPNGRAPEAVWATEEAFLGEGGTFAAPAAVWRRVSIAPPEPLAGREAIGGFRFGERTLSPGESAEFLFLGGISTDRNEPGRWLRALQRPGAASASLERTRHTWQDAAHRVAFGTADRRLDHWLTWVGCQPTLRCLYGCSFLPQFDYGRGGRGWRDLWQDCLALLLSDPSSMRPALLHNLGGVRIDGSNATIIDKDGSFIADRNNIPRTWMDHGVWPTYTTWLYLDQTGDLDFALEPRDYFRDPQIFRCRRQDPRWTPAYGHALRTRRGRVYRGSVFEHLLVQHLTAFFNVGEHNLCRLEGADWNDGLDMAGDRGESVAFSAFYAWNLRRLGQLATALASRGTRAIAVPEEFRLLLDRLPGGQRVAYGSPAAKQRRLDTYLRTVARDLSGRSVRVPVEALVADLEAKHDDLAGRIREQEWITVGRDAWFNGYYDNDGRRVEGRINGRTRMTLTGQVFALMSGIATDDQLDAVVASVDRYLRDPRFGGVRLNTDFGEIQPSLGRAFSFAYGEKENGAVFSHMAVMYAYALYVRRRPREGRRVWAALYEMATNQPVAKIFPCLPEYFNAQGRGLYAYLTGSASWLIHLLLTQVFGIRGELGDLLLDPQLTAEDFNGRDELTVHATFANRPLRIAFRASRAPSTITSVEAGGQPLAFTKRAHGVRIARRAIERLPRQRRTTIVVTLA